MRNQIRALDLAGDEIIKLEGGERPEHDEQAAGKNGRAQRCSLAARQRAAAEVNDQGHRAEVDEIGRVPKAVKDVTCDQQDRPALRDRDDAERREHQRQEDEELE